MSELTFFWDMMSENSHSLDIEIVPSRFKLRHQVTSRPTWTLFPHTTTTIARPPLPPLSALANAHTWANPGQAQWLGGSLNAHPPTFSPPFHLPHHHQWPQQTWHMTTTSWEGQRKLERGYRKGEGGWRRGDDNKAAWNPHAALSNLPPPCPLVYFLFLFYFFYHHLTTRRATHMLRHLFIFISFSCCLTMQRAIHMPRHLFIFISFSCCLTTWHATHMPRCLFLFIFISFSCCLTM